MRPYVLLSSRIAAVAGAVALLICSATAPAVAAPPECNGKPATIVGTGGDDTIQGTDGRDVIVAKGGNDRVFAKGGNDTVCGGDGVDRLYGGNGADWLNGGDDPDAFDNLYGGAGDDRMSYGRLWAGPGNDVMTWGRLHFEHYGPAVVNLTRGVARAPGARHDTVAHINHVHGSSGDDTLIGSSATWEEFWGNDGADVVRGKGGDDYFKGGRGADRMYGGSGYDHFFRTIGKDRIDGGPGRDLIDWEGNTHGVTIDVAAGTVGNGATFTSIGSFDGSDHDDVMRGGSGNDHFAGLFGDDTLTGRGGDDRLFGGDGRDSADGGSGRDRCIAETFTNCEGNSATQ